MARKATANLAFSTLRTECKKLGINSWPEYQKRFKEIKGAKKTLHATYKGQWKGNEAFFGDAATIEKKIPVKVSKKIAPKKTASSATKKTAAKKAVAKKTVKKVATTK